ncbi:MAG: MerR family transcriptional regulator [Ilumatobacter sp.]|uniref:MerR family transcriptional regulator n=1 Tax=Ilumatobacter sp. TaxID=1967498 RepID=UPI003296BCF8
MSSPTESVHHDAMFSIGEVSCRTGVSIDTLRYYERAGLMPEVARGASGQRRYSDDDCGWITFIRRLRATAMPISEIARYTALVRNDEGTPEQRRTVLVRHRDRIRDAIDELHVALGVIDSKIEHYDAAERGVDLDCSQDAITSVRLVD